MTAPLVFLDTETCGLALDADIWEIAAVRRDVDTDGNPQEQELHMFVEHSGCGQLPDEFHQDHAARFPAGCSNRVTSRPNAADAIRRFTEDAHIVGAVPNFDTERIARLIREHGTGRLPRWHYHLIDVENVVVGWLAARSEPLTPPWKSDELSRAVGVCPDKFARHTAMGDVRWVMAQWDAVMGGTR